MKYKYAIERTSQFKKDYKAAVKKGCDIRKLAEVIDLLAMGKELPPKNRDHSLTNSRNYKGVRECHISPDWLLIYKKTEQLLIITLQRTGTHSDLFD